MKLRLKENSVRLRVTRTELARLQNSDRIEEKIVFPGSAQATLSYVLEVGAQNHAVAVAFASHRVVVSISKAQLASWIKEDQVGIYVTLPTEDTTPLEVCIEKDFACLDRSEADNQDTFPNPLSERFC